MDKPTASSIVTAYECGRVRRYHTHPRLSAAGQNDADHSWGVGALLLQLHPHPSRQLLISAIMHDTGERFVGDLPAPAKRENPEMADSHRLLEDAMRITCVYQGDYVLTQDEHDWLKMCDMLECIMFCSLTQPDLLKTGPWVDLANSVKMRAGRLTPEPLVYVPHVVFEATRRAGSEETHVTRSY